MAIIYEKKDHLACLTINRPEAMNALDIPTWVEMDDACKHFHLDLDTWVMTVTEPTLIVDPACHEIALM